MTPQDRDILNQFANGIVPEIKAVSKRFAPTIESEVTDDSLIITANEHIWTLVYGRKPTSPGAKAGSPNLQQILYAWAKAKGITPLPNANGVTPTLLQVSFAMSKSMHLKGDLLYQSIKNGAQKNDIFAPILSESRIESLLGVLEENYYKMLVNGI